MSSPIANQDCQTIETIYYHLLELADQGDFTPEQVDILDTFYV